MSFLDRFRKPKAEARSLENPAVPISDTAALMALFGIAGGNLPAVTAEAALTVPAWASAVGFLSRTLANLSFMFRAVREEWDETTDPPTRTVLEAELYEVSVVADPAYPDAQVALRSLEEVRKGRADHNRHHAEARIAERRAEAEQKFRRIRG